MSFQPSFFRPRRRVTGVAATVGLHLVLLLGWQLARQAHKQPDNVDPDRIEWVDIAPPKPVEPPPSKPPARALPASRAPRAAAAVLPPPRAAEAEAITAPTAPATPTPSAADMMQQARKDLGQIDKDLRREYPGAKIKAPPDSPQLRLERGIEHAAEMAPPRWYEAPKIAELIDPGGTGHKRYRVITAFHTYCVTYNSEGKLEKMTNCPKDEQPATTQKW